MSKVERINVQEILVSQEALNEMSNDQRAMYAILSLSYSELLAMQKILRIGPQGESGSDQIDQIYLSQRIPFIRAMSSKLFEVFKTLRLSGKENSSDDQGLKKFRSDCVLPAYNRIKKHSAFDLVVDIRKKMAFHYDLKAFKTFCDLDNAEQKHSLVVSEWGHSQFFPYGEIVVACALGKKETKYAAGIAKQQIADLGNFTAAAFEELNSIFSKFLEIFVLPKCEDKNIELEVPESLIAIPSVSPAADGAGS